MKLTQEQLEQIRGMEEAEITPKHTGWKRIMRFNRWQNYGKDRLYYAFIDYGRNGQQRNYSKGKGYIDLQTGSVEAPPADRRLIKNLLEA
jgi:hypothetical protein